jgi:hypothetical protein
MATYLVKNLNELAGGECLRPGTVVSDQTHDIQALQTAGVALVQLNDPGVEDLIG